MEPRIIFFELFVLLLVGLLGGLVAIRFRQPIMLGELAAGLAIGYVAATFYSPGTLDSTTLDVLSEIGISALLFDVGLKIHLDTLRGLGRRALAVALMGVIVPFALGYVAALLFGIPVESRLVIAAALTATSVGLTAAVLEETNRADTGIGNMILSAAIFDDIIGLVVLGLITGIVAQGSSSVISLSTVAVKVLAFFAFALLVLRPVATKTLDVIEAICGEKGVTLASFSCLLLLSFISDMIGLDLIVGAFTAGIALSQARERDEIDRAFAPIINIFAGLFFVLVGVNMDAARLIPIVAASPGVLLFCGMLTICATLGKLSCGMAATGSRQDKWVVGLGMVPRGEVGLILANFGRTEGILSHAHFSALVLAIIANAFWGSSMFRKELVQWGKQEGSKK